MVVIILNQFHKRVTLAIISPEDWTLDHKPYYLRLDLKTDSPRPPHNQECTVTAYKNGVKNGHVQQLARLGPGCYFGELALIYNCRRTATVRASVDSRLFVCDRELFLYYASRCGKILWIRFSVFLVFGIQRVSSVWDSACF